MENELKRPKEVVFGDGKGVTAHAYFKEPMDSLLSKCVQRLEEARKLREEADNRFNDAHDTPNPMSDSLMRRYRFLKRKASKIESEVIACLKGD